MWEGGWARRLPTAASVQNKCTKSIHRYTYSHTEPRRKACTQTQRWLLFPDIQSGNPLASFKFISVHFGLFLSGELNQPQENISAFFLRQKPNWEHDPHIFTPKVQATTKKKSSFEQTQTYFDVLSLHVCFVMSKITGISSFSSFLVCLFWQIIFSLASCSNPHPLPYPSGCLPNIQSHRGKKALKILLTSSLLHRAKEGKMSIWTKQQPPQTCFCFETSEQVGRSSLEDEEENQLWRVRWERLLNFRQLRRLIAKTAGGRRHWKQDAIETGNNQV